jgi:class 3 adenylate cyclase
MRGPSQSLAVLFVDISGSTQLYDELGDQEALVRVGRCLAMLQALTEEFRGRLVKTTGDGVMCAFAECTLALHAARAMQIRVTAQRELGGPAVGIHVGCHFGATLESGGDLYGDAVNVAARIAGLAKVGQIIVSDDAAALTDAPLRDRLRMVHSVAVKGKRDPIRIYELVWQEADDLTALTTQGSEERVPRLRLAFGGRDVSLDGGGGRKITLGRDALCDIAVGDRKTSRQHATIECRRDKFALVDHSSNGTFLKLADEDELVLRREEIMLRAHGRIALGHRTSDPEATVITFVCERASS